MNQKATDLHDEFEVDHQVFLAHFQRLGLSNAKLEKKIRDELKIDLSDTAIHRLRLSWPPRTVPVYIGKGSKETWVESVILMKMC